MSLWDEIKAGPIEDILNEVQGAVVDTYDSLDATPGKPKPPAPVYRPTFNGYTRGADLPTDPAESCRGAPIPWRTVGLLLAAYSLVALTVFGMTKYINPCYWNIRQPIDDRGLRASAAVFWPVYLAAAAVSQTFRGADAAADFIFKPASPAEAPPR